ncbi:hypothetical protein K0M31_008250 [Melipona bicolor]|uniref:Uncharacterized protein n=1 Tax=Melipona bicolor TaxID=60889 RepID=A0AA40FR93_9HYME|nr:hypothetical protein K0M31_008250 [Melipona bicolor]
MNDKSADVSFIRISTRRRLVAIFIAILATFTAAVNAKSVTTAVPAGAITAYPIPQRPPYAPNQWIYPKPTVESIHS